MKRSCRKKCSYNTKSGFAKSQSAVENKSHSCLVVVVVAAALIVGSIVLASFERAVGLVKELAVANLSVECHYNDLLSCCAEKYAMLFIKSATTEQQQQQKRTHCEFSF